MSVQIRPVASPKDLHAFVTFPWKVYEGDPLWVPPLIRDEKKLLTAGEHPFHEHGSIQCFLATAPDRSGKPQDVGRIAAIRNRNHEEFHGESVGFFGFYDCLPTTASLERQGVAGVEPGEITAVLMDAVRSWMAEQALPGFLGPMNPSTNETCGLLVEGFDDPPSVMMTYNPPAYGSLLESAGLVKAKDLVSYALPARPVPEPMIRRAESVLERTGVTIRTLDKKNLAEEIVRVQKVYNSAWEKNWGFVPMTTAELDHMARELKPIVEPDFVCFVEHNGDPVGFALALPDVNQALRHANGRLFPLGLLKILWHSRKISRLRVLALGLIEEYRKSGIDQAMYMTIWHNGLKHGMKGGEFSWVLEDNVAMRKPLDRMGAQVTKTYRIYESRVNDGRFDAGRAGGMQPEPAPVT
jgi:hypothetical protein